MLTANTISSLPSPGGTRTGKAGATVPPAGDPKIARTAREFEATFLSLLIKQMRETLEPDGGLFPGDAGDVQGGMFDLFLSQHLADAGGVGLATVIEKQLRPVTHASDARPELPAADRATPRPPSS